MKRPIIPAFAALSLFAATSCDRSSDSKMAELERKAREAEQRQNDLEREIEYQRLAAERAAIERERMEIEEARMEAERQEGEAAAAEAEALAQREEALAKREGRMEQLETDLVDRSRQLTSINHTLTERELELAGREALPFEESPAENIPVADYGVFHDSLSSYGSWFETPDYGYVWQPVVVRDSSWRPYTRGRWACSDRGWTFISDEPFGWATYHYGRWALLRDRGWIWVPGDEWAPSWVCWRESGSHIGWAPLPPETLAYRGRNWDSSVESQFGIGSNWFCFVETRHFDSPLYRHCLPVSNNGAIIRQTTNITFIHIQRDRVICGGPKYRDICDRMGRRLPFYRLEIDSHRRPGGDATGMRPRVMGNRLNVSAPNIQMEWNHLLRPAKVRDRWENVTVERPNPIRTDIVETYRRNRREERQQAEEAIGKIGGEEEFNRHRVERFTDNRRAVEKRLPAKPARERRPEPDRPVIVDRQEREPEPQREAPRQPQIPDRELPNGVSRQPASSGRRDPDLVADREIAAPQEMAEEPQVRPAREERRQRREDARERQDPPEQDRRAADEQAEQRDERRQQREQAEHEQAQARQQQQIQLQQQQEAQRQQEAALQQQQQEENRRQQEEAARQEERQQRQQQEERQSREQQRQQREQEQAREQDRQRKNQENEERSRQKEKDDRKARDDEEARQRGRR